MNKIDALRQKKRMSYKDIADKAGVSSMYICLLAKNKRNNPSLEVMRSVSDALGEKIEKVFQFNQLC